MTFWILESSRSEIVFKDVGDDNWALFHTFLSEVSEKPGLRNNLIFFSIT